MRHLIIKGKVGFLSLTLVTCMILGAVFIAVKADKPVSRNYLFPGVESQIDVLLNNTSGDHVYHILEITPNNETGRIGYLVEGQEPRQLQDKMEEYLRLNNISSSNFSREYYMNTTLPGFLHDDGMNLVQGDTTSEPITLIDQYKEYPLESMVPGSAEYRTLKLEQAENWDIKGEYVENDVGNGNFDTNIIGFSYDETNGTYGVNFSENTWSNPKSDQEDYQIYDNIYKTNVGSLGQTYCTEVNSTEYLTKVKAIQSNSQGTFVATMEVRTIASYPDGTIIPKTLTNQPYQKHTDGTGNITY